MKPKSNLLAFIDAKYYSDGKNYATYCMTWRFMNYFTKFFNIRLCVPVKKTNDLTSLDIPIMEDYNFEIVALPFWDSFFDFPRCLLFNFLSLLRKIHNEVKKNDILWIRIPSIAFFFFLFFSNLYKKPLIIDISGDIRYAWERSKYPGWKAWLVSKFGALLHKLFIIGTKNKFIITTGKELYKIFSKNAKESLFFIRNVLPEREIYYRKDTCLHKPFKILFVGRLMEIKGIFYLLEAFKTLVKEGVDAILYVVGWGPLERRFKEKIKEFNLEKRVKFLGSLPFGPKLLSVYRQADIFILSSLSEGFPRTVIEAWFSGLPVIVSNVGGLIDFVEDKKTGILIKPYSAEEIKEAVKIILNNKKLRRRIISNALKKAKKYSLEAQAQLILNKLKVFYPSYIDNNLNRNKI